MKKDEIIKDMFRELIEKAERHTEIGELPKDLQRRERELESMRERLDYKMELLRKKAELEFNMMIQEQLGDEMEKIHQTKRDLWESIYEHFDINGNDHYSMEDGKIYRVEEVGTEEAAEKVSEFESKMKAKKRHKTKPFH